MPVYCPLVSESNILEVILRAFLRPCRHDTCTNVHGSPVRQSLSSQIHLSETFAEATAYTGRAVVKVIIFRYLFKRQCEWNTCKSVLDENATNTKKKVSFNLEIWKISHWPLFCLMAKNDAKSFPNRTLYHSASSLCSRGICGKVESDIVMNVCALCKTKLHLSCRIIADVQKEEDAVPVPTSGS